MKKFNWLLVAILTIASLFRLPYLNTHMSSLYGDEIAIGYNALSIVKTGRDEFGRFMPLQFESWGDQKNPVYIYAVAFVQLFTGATPASVRIPSALAGIVAVYLTYRLVMLLKLGQGAALFSALLLSLTPWHIHISRGGYEANLALTLGLASVIYLLQKKNFLSVLMLVLSTYTYYTTKIFAPALLLLTWTWIVHVEKPKIWLKPFIKYWLGALVLAIPIIYLALFADGQARFKAINIFADKTVSARVIRDRNFFDDAKSFTAKVLENRFTYHYQDFFTYYLDNFSGQFLFVGGDSNLRYGLGNHGMLYLIDAPLILAGIILLYSKNRKAWLFLFAWLLLAPLATSLVGRAYGLRSLVMLPVLQIFAGYSLHQLYSQINKSKIITISYILLAICYALAVSIWTIRYIYQYPSYGKYWYDGAMYDSLQFAKEHEAQYDQIIITQSYGEVSMYYAFYNQIDPRVYRQAKDNKLTIDGVPMIKIGKYYFGDIRPKGPIEQMDLPHNTLLIVQPLFEYGEEDILARDDGRVIFRTFDFPTVHMKASEAGTK
ncbi:glycosyltransferase family 39 protein [Candidatus Woesebacteria bacterium]|nr:glycosyltransferase family 39 protein [Candidatus Woesebacteria bacterium]